MQNHVRQGLLARIRGEIGKVFIGDEQAIHLLLTGLFSGLSVLIEDIPGVGKTSLARSLAASCRLDFGRIQFTPDLMPSDILGMTVWSQEAARFVFKSGAIMHQFILADEINRAAARTQSALLEAMQEGTVTIEGVSHPLPRPFFLVATQNPYNFAGTFQLPEAQLDRFGLSFSIGYPNPEEEDRIGQLIHQEDPLRSIQPVIDAAQIEEIRAQVRAIQIVPPVRQYAIRLAQITRETEAFRSGVSPRAGQQLLRAAQASAWMDGRDYVLPEDVRAQCLPTFSHRLSANQAAVLQGKTIPGQLSQMLSTVRMPSGL